MSRQVISVILIFMPESKIPHDAAYQAFFSNPDMVKSLILDFVPEEFVKHFDFGALEECPASYISGDFQQRQTLAGECAAKIAGAIFILFSNFRARRITGWVCGFLPILHYYGGI